MDSGGLDSPPADPLFDSDFGYPDHEENRGPPRFWGYFASPEYPSDSGVPLMLEPQGNEDTTSGQERDEEDRTQPVTHRTQSQPRMEQGGGGRSEEAMMLDQSTDDWLLSRFEMSNFPPPAGLGGADKANQRTYERFIEQYVLPIWDTYDACSEKGTVDRCNITFPNLPSLDVPVLYMKTGYPNREQACGFMRKNLNYIIIDYITTPEIAEGQNEYVSKKGNKASIGGPQSGTTKTIKGRSVQRKGGSYDAFPGEDTEIKLWHVEIDGKGEQGEEEGAASKKRKQAGSNQNNGTRFCLCYFVTIPVKAATDMKEVDTVQQSPAASSDSCPKASNVQPTAAGDDRKQGRDDFVNLWAPRLKKSLVRHFYHSEFSENSGFPPWKSLCCTMTLSLLVTI